jgi:ATP synthase protein I
MDENLKVYPPSSEETAFARDVAAKAARKIRLQRNGPQSVWFGLGMSGLIGWSVAIPTLLGALLGVWWDRHHSGAHSWTLMLLALGLVIGCLNAWHWIVREDKAMNQEPKDEDE